MRKEPTLLEDLALAKAEYAARVKRIKDRHAFKNASPDQKAKLLQKYDPETRKNRWGGLRMEDRFKVARVILSKAHAVKAQESEYSGLSLSSLRLMPSKFMLEIYPLPGCRLTIIEGLQYRLAPSEKLGYVQRYFPNIKQLY